MKILIAGGTGFIGTALVAELLSAGHSPVILTRDRARVGREGPPHYAYWDGLSLSTSPELQGIEGVVNLAGETINQRWTSQAKDRILQSRILATKALVKAIQKNVIAPKVLLNASAVGYYGPQGDEEITEESPPGEGFLAEVCQAWEKEAREAEKEGVRVVTTRFGVVLGKGGALKKMEIPFRCFVGGPVGSGQQWVSWIHIEDLARAIRLLVESETFSGPVNGTSPNPVPMKHFSRALGAAMKRPSWLPVPGFALRILLGEMSSMILTGQRVFPVKLMKAGFQFNYPTVEEAMGEIYK